MLETFFQQLANGLLGGSLYALFAVGLTLTFGILRITNFAHGEFLMTGAVVAYALTISGLPFVLALLAGGLAAALLGIIIERITFRYTLNEPINGLVVSLGLIAILQNVAAKITGTQPHFLPPAIPGVIDIGGVVLANQRIATVAIALLTIVVVWLLLKKTALGRSLRALAVDPMATSLMGARTNMLYSVAFGIGCALAGIAGALMAMLFPITPFMGGTPVAKGFIVIVLGSLGSIPGAIVGGLLLGIVEALGAGYISSAFRDGFGFVVLILLLIVRPTGLFGVPERRA